MENICTPKKCKEYGSCKQINNPFLNSRLCKGYEKYANQDFVNKKENTFSDLNIISDINSNKEIFNQSINKKRLIIELIFKGKGPSFIAKQLNVSVQWVCEVKRKAKNKILEMI